MSRTPLVLPALRNVHERTGGLNLFSWQGNTSILSVDRLRPVHGSDVPGFGSRMNSGRTNLWSATVAACVVKFIEAI